MPPAFCYNKTVRGKTIFFPDDGPGDIKKQQKGSTTMKQRSLLRVLTLLMAVVMIASLIPAVPAQAADTLAAATTTLTEADVIVTEPRAGKLPDYSVQVDGTGYTGQVANWYCGEIYSEAYIIPKNSPFEAGQRYWALIYLTPEEGYDFASKVQVSVNGRDATEDSHLYPDGDYILRLDFIPTQEVTSVKGNVTAPKTGHTPSYTCQVPSGANYTAKVANWFIGESFEGSTLMGRDETFQSGQYYWAVIYFTPKVSYDFAQKTEVTVNGIDDPGESFRYPDGDYVVRVRFPCGVELTSVEGSVTEPKPGHTPSYTCQVPSGANYTAKVDSWYIGASFEGSTLMGRNEAFQSDQYYWAVIYFTPKDGYEFAEQTKVTVNSIDDPEKSFLYPDGDYVVQMRFPCGVLTSAQVSVTAPVAGQMPSKTGQVPSGANYTASIQSWLKGDGTHYPSDMEWDETFLGGRSYMVLVNIVPKNGFTFADDAVFYLNGKSIERDPDHSDLSFRALLYAEPDAYTLTSAEGEVVLPVAGQEPSFTCQIPAGANYIVQDVDWFMDNSPNSSIMLHDGDTFEAGQTYSPGVVFMPKEGYHFAEDVTATLSGRDCFAQLTMYDYVHLVAQHCNFTVPDESYDITVSSSDAGAYNTGGDQVTSASVGAKIVLKSSNADPTQYVFDQWIADSPSGLQIDSADREDGASFIMPSSDVNIRAVYKRISDTRPESPFTDVKPTDWFYDAVIWATGEKIASGTGDNRFSPHVVCTRAQAVTMLWRAAGSPAPSQTNISFTDVSENAWYYQPVMWAVENDITAGTGNNAFSPDMACTRAQIVAFLWKAHGMGTATIDNPFTDVPDDAWFCKPILWAVENGITTGTSDTTFSPNMKCARSHIVTFLYKAK